MTGSFNFATLITHSDTQEDNMKLLITYLKMQSLAYCSLNFESVESQNKAFKAALKAWNEASLEDRNAAIKLIEGGE